MFQTRCVVHILLIRASSTRHGVDAGPERHHGRTMRHPVDPPSGFVSLRWDKKRHPSRLRASAAVGGRSGWCTGGRLPIMIDRRGGCRVPLPAPDLHRRLRGYVFRREATSALRNILSERPRRPENPAGKRMADARQPLVMRALEPSKRPSLAWRALSSRAAGAHQRH